MMHISYHKIDEHAELLKRGLHELGSNFIAKICYWCEGRTMRNFEHCHVCGDGKMYGSALGLLIDNKPASDSVVNQVLVAATKDAHP